MIGPTFTKYAFLMLLNQRPQPVFGGTANENALVKRRAKNKVARRSRRVNRLRSA